MTSSELSFEFEQNRVVDVSDIELNAGFSLRFHQLLDCVADLDIPKEHARSRQAYIAQVTGQSEHAAHAWLELDQVPSDDVLESLVRFFLHYTHCQVSALRVESWLRYGDDATPNPFLLESSDDVQVALRSKALRLLNDQVKEDDIALSSYQLQPLLDDLCRLLKSAEHEEKNLAAETLKAPLLRLLDKHAK